MFNYSRCNYFDLTINNSKKKLISKMETKIILSEILLRCNHLIS